ncbi:MAG: hypothetical protein AAF432_08840 [Planctomycetota bacterium]
MIRTIVWLVLSLSLLFNLFFAVGYVQAKRQADQAASSTPVEQISKTLRLDDTQESIYRDLKTSMRTLRDQAMADMRAIQMELADVMGDPNADRSRVEQIVERSDALRETIREAELATLEEFLGVLSVEQQNELLGRLVMEKHHRRRPTLRERCDTNGDGHLDDEEWTRFDQQLRDRQRSFRDRFMSDTQNAGQHRILERFDANKNGVLDPEEREAFEAFREEHGWGRRGGGRPGSRRH